jgi:hypothetical protein
VRKESVVRPTPGVQILLHFLLEIVKEVEVGVGATDLGIINLDPTIQLLSLCQRRHEADHKKQSDQTGGLKNVRHGRENGTIEHRS